MRNEDNREDSSNIDNLLLLHPNNLVFISKSFRRDLPGIFIEVNNTAIKTLGYSSDELQSMTFFDLISQEDISLLEKRRKKLIEDSYVEYTITCITKDRKKISLHCKNYLLLSNTDIIELTIAKEEDAVRKKSEEKQVVDVVKVPEINLDIFEKNGLAALLLDDNLNIIQANAIFLEMTMVSRSDSISLNLFDFVKKDYLRKEFSKSIINEQDESLFPLSINGVLMDANNDHKSIKMNVGRYQQGYYVISFIDQTKQELLQNALSTSEKKYRELVQNAHDMIFLYPISEDGKRGSFIEVNRKAYERLGYSREELLEKKLPDIVRRGNNKEHLKEEILEETKIELLKTGTAVRDGILVSKNGEEIPTEFRASMFTIETEEVILVIARDISERQKAEQALRESEEKYSTVVESSNDGILIAQEYKIIFANKMIAEVLDYAHEEIIGLAPKDLVSKEHQDMLADYSQRRYDGDPTVPVRYEINLISSKGKEIPFEINVSLIEYMGKPATANILRDISERKKAEQALRESEEKYSTVVESSNDGIIISQDKRIVYANSKFAEMLEYSPEDLVGLIVTELVSKEYKELVKDYSQRRLDGDQNVPTRYEVNLVSSNGKVVPCDANVSFIEFKNKPATVNVIRDMSERKKTEQTLKESEERYRLLFDNAKDMIFVLSKEDQLSLDSRVFVDLNKEASKFLGFSREEFVQKSVREIVGEGSESAVYELIKQLNEKQQLEGEFTVFGYDGQKIIVDLKSKEIELVGKKLSVSIARDITERKKTEQALKESEEKYRLLFDNAKDMIFLFSREDHLSLDSRVFIDLNKAALDVLGYSKEEIVQKSIAEIFSEETRLAFYDLNKQLNEKQHAESEISIRRRDGQEIHVHFSAVEIELGGIKRSLSIARDITDRKILEENLRKSEKKFRELFENANDMIFLYELSNKGERSNFVDVNELACEKLGYSKEDLLKMKLTDIVHEQYEGHMNDSANQLIKQKEAMFKDKILFKEQGKGEFISKSGNLIPIEYTVTISLMEDKYLIQTIVRDVSDKQEAEKEIRENEQKYRQLFNNMFDMVMVISRAPGESTGKLIEVNEQVCKILGYSKEEMFQINPLNLIAKDSHADFYAFSEEVKEKKSITGDLIVQTKTGDKHPVEFALKSFKMNENEITLIMFRENSS